MKNTLSETIDSLYELPFARAQRTNNLPGDQKQLAAAVNECFEQLRKLNGELTDDFRVLIGVTEK